MKNQKEYSLQCSRSDTIISTLLSYNSSITNATASAHICMLDINLAPTSKLQLHSEIQICHCISSITCHLYRLSIKLTLNSGLCNQCLMLTKVFIQGKYKCTPCFRMIRNLGIRVYTQISMLVPETSKLQ